MYIILVNPTPGKWVTIDYETCSTVSHYNIFLLRHARSYILFITTGLLWRLDCLFRVGAYVVPPHNHLKLGGH